MKRPHKRNLLARSSLWEVCVYLLYDLYSYLKKLREKQERDSQGTSFMLTFFAILARWLNRLGSVYPRIPIRIPIFSFTGFYGLLAIYLAVAAITFWPKPSIPLDGAELVEVSLHQTPETAFLEDIEVFTDAASIPEELYPYETRQPLTVTPRALPTKTLSQTVVSSSPEESDSQKTTATVIPITTNQKKIQPQKGFYHTVQKNESIYSIAVDYRVSYLKVKSYNPDINPRRMQPGDKIYIPGSKDAYRLASSHTMILPLKSTLITSPYGMRKHPLARGTGGRNTFRFHKGIDLKANTGTLVLSVMDGKVISSGWRNSYMGYTVELQHANGIRTVYAHCSKLLVKRGESVRQGQIIAKTGKSGKTTGPHLHFEVIKNGKHQNPINFLPRLRRL